MGYIFLEGAIEIMHHVNLRTELLNEDIGGLELFISIYRIQIAEKSWEGRKETCFFFFKKKNKKPSLAFVCLRHPMQYLILLLPGVPFTGLFNLKVGK